MGIPAVADDFLLPGTPVQGVRVLLADVSLDGAELEGGQGAAAHHAHHAVPGRVEVHQVLQPPVLMVVATMVTARNAQADSLLSEPPGKPENCRPEVGTSKNPVEKSCAKILYLPGTPGSQRSRKGTELISNKLLAFRDLKH